MKILKINAGILTNFEVLDLLHSRGAAKDPTRAMGLLKSSEFKVYDYLLESAACDQTRESINDLIEKFKEYQLPKAELISIINNRPSSAVELAPIIEALEQRNWNDDTLDEMAELIVQVLPPRPDQKNTNEEGTAEDNGAQATDENTIAQMTDENNTAQVAAEDNKQVSDGDNGEEEMDDS
ncbi:DNA-directed RNA polymerase III subunit RPC9-like isoform X1 [Chenopodium quinoa]|uniref:DNA-directed RNA polymerase III subunit RPC9-like isoform X1 n=2 Tax=Chenopodium quinoa TaxID=63459 RepID=UPI000B778489|nr:DNA-directed RNA polymerase III subunit RPC9-like isoform X1 [Chenopodium quinoa]